jgi:hypothetical protein
MHDRTLWIIELAQAQASLELGSGLCARQRLGDIAGPVGVQHCLDVCPDLWGAKTAPTTTGLQFPESPGGHHAACSYSVISLPRTLRRRICAVARSVMVTGAISSAPGGRRFQARCGRCSL